MLSTIFLSFLLLFQMPTAAAQSQQSPQPKPVPVAQAEEPLSVTKHSIRAGGRQLNYTVTTGFMPIKDRAGETEAKIFFMAYTLDGVQNPKDRPLMFSFNGGPGSSSVWLHLGALGPKRVKMLDDGLMPPPPYELIDNPDTWLTETDLVFIDPVGTGYSRAAKADQAAKFFSLNGDIESVGEFMRMYLVRNERWASPLFLVGESYGTTRASGLAGYLFERGIAFNGIALVSSVMNFQTIRFAEGNDLTNILIFPSYAATAWYHKKLPADLQSKPLATLLKEAEDFAAGELSAAMMKSDRMTASEKQTAVDKFARLSGLKSDFVAQHNMRVDLGEFLKELMRDQRRSAGRLDSRFLGIDRDAGGNSPDHDPSMSAIRTPYTATLNDYIRRDLDFKSDLEYYILGGGIGQWNWNTNNGYANTSVALREAMAKNPYMKVFVASGYYDMATPYFATEYTLANMNLDPQLRRNIYVSYYEAGHMMYIEKNSLRKLKEDITAFIRNALSQNNSRSNISKEAQINAPEPSGRLSMDKISNPVVYFEIPVTDVGRATKFYKSVFDFEFTEENIDNNEMALFPFSEKDSGISGALAKGEIYKPSKSGTLVYFHTTNIENTLAKVQKNGGQTLYPKTSIGDLGYVAEFEDSEGNRIALHSREK